MINQAPIVRYMASVCEIFFADFCKKTFSAESQYNRYTLLIPVFRREQFLEQYTAIHK